MITKVAFIGIPVKDMTRAKEFYGDRLGLKHMFDGAEGKYAEFDAPDSKSIGLEQFSPQDSPPYLALETDNIEAEVERMKGEGVKFLGDVMDNQVCKMVLLKDPEGHTLMLHEMAPDRKKE